MNPLAGLVVIGAALALGRTRNLSGTPEAHAGMAQTLIDDVMELSQRTEEYAQHGRCSEASAMVTMAEGKLALAQQEINWSNEDADVLLTTGRTVLRKRLPANLLGRLMTNHEESAIELAKAKKKYTRSCVGTSTRAKLIVFPGGKT